MSFRTKHNFSKDKEQAAEKYLRNVQQPYQTRKCKPNLLLDFFWDFFYAVVILFYHSSFFKLFIYLFIYWELCMHEDKARYWVWGVFLSHSPLTASRQCLSQSWKLAGLSRLAGQQTLRIYRFLPPHLPAVPDRWSHTQSSSADCWGFELRSSRLRS